MERDVAVLMEKVRRLELDRDQDRVTIERNKLEAEKCFDAQQKLIDGLLLWRGGVVAAAVAVAAVFGFFSDSIKNFMGLHGN